MNEDNRNQEEFEEEQSFAELLEQSLVKPVRLKPGQKIKAKIIEITNEWIFLDIGGKSEGYLDKRELLDVDGFLTVQEGDTIQAYFLSAEGNGQLFTTKIGGGETGRGHLEEAWRSGIPVAGVVEKEIKGGFEIKIAGNIRGFCPYSQMGLHRVEDSSAYIGERLSFKITDYGERGRNIVLSNRAYLEEERQAQREALKTTLEEGMIVSGVVTSIRNFGAFVDIGGVQGLIPISEMGWGHVEDIHDLLTVSQEVEVMIMKLDWDKDRFSLSLKKTLRDPWEDVVENYPEGTQHAGKVSRLTNFGAFVTLAEGIDGLLHISKLGQGRRIKHPREVVDVGQTIAVKIDSLDKDNKRLSLSLAGAQQDGEKEIEEDYRRYTGEIPKSMGTLGDLLKAGLAKKDNK